MRDGNAGGRNQRMNAGNVDGNAKNVGNQDWDARNQGGNLNIATEITSNSNGNDKFKDRREVKIIENDYICKNLVLYI